MKIYRSERDGVTVWRLTGIVERLDAIRIIRAMKGAGKRLRGCHIIDFTGVDHVDYHAFRLFENRIPVEADVLLCGLSDYVLDIFAFVRRKRHLRIYRDWREAIRHILHERGKMLTPVTPGFTGFE